MNLNEDIVTGAFAIST